MTDIAGATLYRGIMGYGANQGVHKSGFLGISHDLPIMVTIVDTDEKIRRAISALDEMVDESMIVLSDVEVIKYTHTRGEAANDQTSSQEKGGGCEDDRKDAGRL